MKRKRRRLDTGWRPVTLAMPGEFVPAVSEIARHYGIPPLEYCRRALLLRLKADGVCLEEYEGEAGSGATTRFIAHRND
jgi:hypothetical protein